MYTVNETYVWDLLEVSKEEFGGNIYVKCNEHPCGWDSININYTEDIFDEIDITDISNGIYDSHPFADKTLFDVIVEVGIKGWSLGIPTICPEDFRKVSL